jgi:four helix bundle protein
MESDKQKFKNNFTKRLIDHSISIINLTDQFPNQPKYWPIKDQLIRSSTSIGANVIEAKSSSSKKDYIHFFEIALKSANETEYWLMLVDELDIVVKTQLTENNEISCILASSLLTLKNKK